MKRLCKNKHWKINKEYNLDKILYLLIDRPNDIDHWNIFVWKNNNNKCHRDYNLPAMIWITGDGILYINGKYLL